ncbi:MAG: preprotein translocase subunit SecD, partial [Methanothrix sp.]|nr:preprotein translocase subunit SecD [Methanothrix sp.]
MSLLNDLSKDRRVVLYAVVVALAIIFLGAFGLKFGLDLEGGSYLQLQLQGAEAQIDVAPEKILEVQFNASSIEKHGQSYVVNVPGKIKATLADDLGYSGAKIAEGDNSTKITIFAAPETVVINYLKKNLDADVKLNVDTAPVRYEIRTNVTRESLDALLAPVGGKIPTGEETFVEGVTPETVDETKKVLDSKLNRLGLQDIKVRVVDNKYILIDLAGMDVATAQDVVGKPGKFEIRIQTENNQSMHVLYGDA